MATVSGGTAAVLIVLAALLVAVIGFIALSFFLKWLAKENILLTTAKEGTAKVIMRGDSFDRLVLSFKKYHLNDPKGRGYRSDRPDWEILYHGPDNENGFSKKNEQGENEQEDKYYDRRPWLLKHLGLYWVGWHDHPRPRDRASSPN